MNLYGLTTPEATRTMPHTDSGTVYACNRPCYYVQNIGFVGMQNVRAIES